MVKSHINSISYDNCDNLWGLLTKGDRKGLEGLYRIFTPELFKYGLSMVRDEDFIQDLIQEVFIDLLKYHLRLMTSLQEQLGSANTNSLNFMIMVT